MRYVAPKSQIVCVNAPACPRPSAVNELLAIATPDHEVELKANGFAMKHPLIERVDDALFNCPLFTHLDAIMKGESEDYTPGLGRYWVRQVGEDWVFRDR